MINCLDGHLGCVYIKDSFNPYSYAFKLVIQGFKHSITISKQFNFTRSSNDIYMWQCRFTSFELVLYIVNDYIWFMAWLHMD